MSCGLTVTDCFGREVVLDHSNWVKHERRGAHPEVARYHDSFVLVLQDPDFVVEAVRDGHQHFYRRGIAAHRYLHLVVVNFESVYKITAWWLSPQQDIKGMSVYERK